MGPISLTNLFSYKSEKTNDHLGDISIGLCLPKPRTNNMKNSFMTEHSFGTLFQKKLGKANHLLPFEIAARMGA